MWRVIVLRGLLSVFVASAALAPSSAAFAGNSFVSRAAPGVFAVAQNAQDQSSPAPPPSASPQPSSGEQTSPAPPASEEAGGSARAAPVAEATLPRDLTPWGMFAAADWVVKAVMIGLVFASVVSWTVALVKALELLTGAAAAQKGVRALGEARSLQEGTEQLRRSKSVVRRLWDVAVYEVRLSGEGMDKAGVKERAQSRLERIEAAAARRIARGVGILATIGATAPFVGLFGTVWGIMNSFIGISKQQTTNLAVVAPGIAEALLATALGLVAAIPAVVIYNMLARSITSYRALLADASAEILRLLSRDLDRGLLQRGAGNERVRIPDAAE